MQVVRASCSASPVLPTKPSTSPASHLAAVDGERRERGEVRVVELVAVPVAEPEPVAADVVPADREDRAVGDGEDRRAERREDVLAVVPAGGGAAGAEGVGERRRPVDREDVAAGRQLASSPAGARGRAAGRAPVGAASSPSFASPPRFRVGRAAARRRRRSAAGLTGLGRRRRFAGSGGGVGARPRRRRSRRGSRCRPAGRRAAAVSTTRSPSGDDVALERRRRRRPLAPTRAARVTVAPVAEADARARAPRRRAWPSAMTLPTDEPSPPAVAALRGRLRARVRGHARAVISPLKSDDATCTSLAACTVGASPLDRERARGQRPDRARSSRRPGRRSRRPSRRRRCGA